MGKGFLTAVGAVLAGTGLALGQPPAPPSPSLDSTPITHPAPSDLSHPPTVTGNGEGPVTNCFATDNQCNFRELSVGLDYLLSFLPKSHESSIIAVNPVLGSLPGVPLISGGDESLDRHIWSGGRLTIGYWFDESNPFNGLMPLRTFGLETRLFSLGQRSITAVNGTSPFILRPFFDINNRVDSALIVAAPGLSTGSVVANAKMNMWGGEANVWKCLYDNGTPTTFGLWFIAGYRYLEVDPEVQIDQVSVYGSNLSSFPAFASFEGNRVQGSESFAARNQFNGGQVGINLKAFGSGCILDTSFKFALGTNHEELNIQGTEVRTFANGTKTVSQGVLLALPSNIGRFSRDRFCQIPEIDFGVVVPVLNWLTLRTDFSAMYLSRIVRASDQINRAIDISQIPNFPAAASATPTGLNLPTVPFNQSDLWVLGISIGMELKW
jgi:hypothetical protein